MDHFLYNIKSLLACMNLLKDGASCYGVHLSNCYNTSGNHCNLANASMITLRAYWICLVEKVKFMAHTIGAYHKIMLICTSVYMKIVGAW